MCYTGTHRRHTLLHKSQNKKYVNAEDSRDERLFHLREDALFMTVSSDFCTTQAQMQPFSAIFLRKQTPFIESPNIPCDSQEMH